MSGAPVGNDAYHFDYLDECGEQLGVLLNISGLAEKITMWRVVGGLGGTSAGMPAMSCRAAAEHALRVLMRQRGADPERYGNHEDRIDGAREQEIISDVQAKWLHSIRTIGNKSVHPDDDASNIDVSIYDCKVVLTAFDDFLRSLVKEHGFSSSYDRDVPAGPPEALFIARDKNLMSDAEIAALMSEKEGYRQEALGLEKDLREHARLMENGAERYAQLASMLDEQQKLNKQEKDRLKAQIADLERELVKYSRDYAADVADAAIVRTRVNKVLSEYDFVKQLLAGGGSSNMDQWRVMEFPRSADVRTNFLQISGEGGTGKTLCLVAKLLQEIAGKGQLRLGATQVRKALFVCFNKPLAKYVESLVASHPYASDCIDIVNYDYLVNQLVRSDPDDSALAQYADDVRYPSGWRISYPGSGQSEDKDAFKTIGDSMTTVAARVSDEQLKRARNYLDASIESNISFMKDEIAWLEERYACVDDAKAEYVEKNVPRKGRGGERRPRAEARGVIVAVWAELLDRMRRNEKYTIGQATWRLMGSKELPKYDAIAIDEAQDFSLSRIRLLTHLRRDESSFMYIAGDEGQRLYQRDFTWSELSRDVHGYTVTLTKNMRNPPSINAFAKRLHGSECSYLDACENVRVVRADDRQVMDLAVRLLGDADKSVAVIGNGGKWRKVANEANLGGRLKSLFSKSDVWHAGSIMPGLYCVNELVCKGLEFDYVIVDLESNPSVDDAAEADMRYVNFTRSREKLYVRYSGSEPAFLRKYYFDFL